MQNIYFIFILILSFSCSKGQNDSRISQFESILGEKESNTLTYLVEDFEKNYLQKNYPNLNTDDAYKKFLKDVNETGKTPIPMEILKDGFERFEKSNLKLEIYSIPDSVWIERNKNKTTFKSFDPTLMIKWKSLKNDGTYEYRTSESSTSYLNNMTEDEIIAFSTKRKEINYFGKYNEAIKTIFNEPSFVNDYFEYRDLSGNSNPLVFITRILNSDSDFNDYFIKRITVIELAYW
jgi:hypothetical protein